MKNLINSFIIAFSMYSKIPVPQTEWKEENMTYAMCFWPLVGAVIGFLTYAWGHLGTLVSVNTIFYTIILMMISVIITGGIHLDGLLDTSDAMSSWQTRERRLEILKDSHAGAFAVIKCTIYFFLLFAVYSQINLAMLQVTAVGFVLSRSMSAFAIVTFPKARKDGSVAALSRGAKTKRVQIIMGFWCIICAILMIVWQPLYGLAAIIGALLVFWYYYHMAMKYFGGTTGDLAGWFLSVCELVMPFACIVLAIIREVAGI